MKQKFRDWFSRGPLGVIHLIAVLVLAFTTVYSTVSLQSAAIAEPRAVQLPGTGSPRVVDVGLVPDTLARDFAVDFLVSFETYSPETVEASAAFTRSRVAPRVVKDFARLLENRKDLVRESGMVSHILIEGRSKSQVIRSDEGPTIEVIVSAHRKIYIAGRLTESARLIYRVGLESAEPTRDNPTGLFITGQSVRVVPSKVRHGNKGDRRDG